MGYFKYVIVEKEAFRCRVIDPGSEGKARASTGRARMKERVFHLSKCPGAASQKSRYRERLAPPKFFTLFSCYSKPLYSRSEDVPTPKSFS